MLLDADGRITQRIKVFSAFNNNNNKHNKTEYKLKLITQASKES